MARKRDEHITTGRTHVRPDTPSHVKGVPEGNAVGNYEKHAGHLPDGRSTAARSTGINVADRDPIDPDMPNLSPA
ncbi:hypothetical protein [Nonomuraea sp. LPB2021202275-12-8]|uniref:hypothetical protein n=1 Tax=Nonomuraea sp. LPB2021202275-12-8 TaxID=3120159 RepID=UPI00300CAADE